MSDNNYENIEKLVSKGVWRMGSKSESNSNL